MFLLFWKTYSHNPSPSSLFLLCLFINNLQLLPKKWIKIFIFTSLLCIFLHFRERLIPGKTVNLKRFVFNSFLTPFFADATLISVFHGLLVLHTIFSCILNMPDQLCWSYHDLIFHWGSLLLFTLRIVL